MDAVVLYPQIGTKNEAADATGSLHAKIGALPQLVSENALTRITQASDDLRASADTLVGGTSISTTTYSGPWKEIVSNVDGVVRVSFVLTKGTGLWLRGKIYVNGAARGIEQSNTTTSPITYTEDVAVQKGDRIQIYLYAESSSGTNQLSNFRVYYSLIPVTTPIVTRD